MTFPPAVSSQVLHHMCRALQDRLQEVNLSSAYGGHALLAVQLSHSTSVFCFVLCFLQTLQTLQEVEIDSMEGQRDYELVRQVLSYERDRVRFLLKAYLRARLEKIEQSAGEIADRDEANTA
jgi:hypothetical protein